MKNRRNYYRILQVQPDAPIEIIRTSYRALMRDLKKHPDLGGDHWTAAVVNEAYETLSDAIKRAAYDRELFEHYSMNILSQRESHKKSATGIHCPVCKKSTGRPVPSEENCTFCRDAQSTDTTTRHSNCYRSVARMKKDETLVYSSAPRQEGREAKMLDLSPKGVRFICPEKLREESTIKIGCPLFKAVAKVVNHKTTILKGKTHYSVGAQFLSVQFGNSSGSFYSNVI